MGVTWFFSTVCEHGLSGRGYIRFGNLRLLVSFNFVCIFMMCVDKSIER